MRSHQERNEKDGQSRIEQQEQMSSELHGDSKETKRNCPEIPVLLH